MPVPENPPIYHIVHFDRLPFILSDGKLFSDHIMLQQNGGRGTSIGMNKIKARRLSLPVGSQSNGTVGQYVPFYFCPRSVMLYLMYKADHVDLTYRGGQDPIIHLVTNFDKVIAWAQENNRSWAFTPSNAGAFYTEFYFKKGELGKLDWDAIPANDFRAPEIKEAKQSEFLLKDDCPWFLIDEIGVFNDQMKKTVEAIMKDSDHKPIVRVHREWYYDYEQKRL